MAKSNIIIYCYSFIIGIADKRGTGDRKDVSEVIVGTRDVSSISLAMDHLVPDTLRNFPKKAHNFLCLMSVRKLQVHDEVWIVGERLIG